MTPNRNTHCRHYSRRRRRIGRGGLSEVGVVAVGGNSKFLLDDTLPTNERSGSQAQQQKKVLADYYLRFRYYSRSNP